MAQEMALKNSPSGRILFISSVAVLVYWTLSRTVDIYRFAVVGAIYEILWLFMLIALVGLPILSIVFLIKEGFNIKSLYLYTILIAVTSILVMVLVR